MNGRPPRLAEALLRVLLPPEEREELLGDLQERFGQVVRNDGAVRAWLWYWRQTLPSIPLLTKSRLSPALRSGRLTRSGAWSLSGLAEPLRIFRHEPGFALTAATLLALGIGIPTTLYSVEHGIFRALPVPAANQVVAVQRLDAGTGQRMGFSPESLEAMRQMTDAFSGIAGYRPGPFQLDGWEGAAQIVSGATVSPDVFPLLGVEPRLGRPLLAGDAVSGAPAVVVLGERLWRVGYGARDDVLGRVVRVNGVPRTVVGVMPEKFGFPVNATAWIPLGFGPPGAGATRGVEVVARLTPRTTPERARARVAAFVLGGGGGAVTGSGGASEQVDPPRAAVRVIPFQATFLGSGMVARAMLFLLFFVLVIAAANVANLLLARAVRRRKELAIRMALGSSRRRIIGEQLTQALLLSMIGVAGGVGLAWMGTSWFRAHFGPRIDVWWVSLRLDGSAALFAAGCGVLITILAGVAPALQASGVHLQDALKDGARDPFRHVRFSRLSVAVQLALSCAFLVLVTQIVRGVGQPTSLPGGAEATHILAGQLRLASFDYADQDARRVAAGRIEAGLAALPGASGAALSGALPGAPAPSRLLLVRDHPTDAPLRAQVRGVTPSFFSLMHADMVEGRAFAERPPDGRSGGAAVAKGPREAVIDESLASVLAPDGSPLGRRLWISTSAGVDAADSLGVEVMVVGVVGAEGVAVDGRGRPQSALFVPLESDMPTDLVFLVGSGPALSMGAVRTVLARVAPDVPLYRSGALAELVGRAHAMEGDLAGMFGGFGLVTLVMALAGLQAVVAFSVGQRARELGLRRALGATAPRLLRDALRGIGVACAWGLASGTLMAWLAAPLVAPMFGNGSPHGPAFAGVPLLLAGAALVAALLTGRRAVTLDPMQTLQAD